MTNKGKLQKSKEITFKDHAELDNYLKTGNFALMTGHTDKLSPEESHKQFENMQQDLKEMGIPFTHVGGKWGGLEGEPSLMVHGIDEKTASDLARKYQQISHIQSTAGKHREISHDPTYTPPQGGAGHEFGNHLEDNYSEIKLPSGDVSRFQVNTGYANMKKDEETLKQEELEKTSKNVKAQKKKLFGTQGNPAPKSKFGQKQIEQQKKFAQSRYGVDVKPSKGKIDKKTGKRKEGSVEGFDKPDWRGGDIESQWNPGAITHEFGHLEQMPEGRTPEEHQTVMDKEVGEAVKIAGAPTHAFRHPSEVQARAAENPLRRRMGLPPLTTNVKVKEGEAERKVLGTDEPAAVRYKDKKGQLVDQLKTGKLLSEENKERMDMIDSGELVYDPKKGWQEGTSPDAKINRRAREAAKKGHVSYFRSMLQKPEKLAASEDVKKGQDPLAAQLTSEKGVSERGIEARRADSRNKGVVSHGYGRSMSQEKHAARAKDYFRSALKAIQSQPKPNLPKSELEKSYSDKKLNDPNRHHEFGINPQSKRHAEGTSVMGGHIRDKSDPVIPLKDQAKNKLKHLKQAPKPNLPKSEKPLSFEDIKKNALKPKIGISPQSLKQQAAQLPPVKAPAAPPAPTVSQVAGIALPKELHQHFHSGEVVPYDHPHRELAAKFVTDVWRKNRAEGARMSEKLLGIGEGGKPTTANAKQGYSTLKSEKITKNEQPKYVHIHQSYRDVINRKPNPFLKQRIGHVNDLKEVSQYHGRDMHTISTNPKPGWGTEVHKINPDGSLTLIGADYDTSD